MTQSVNERIALLIAELRLSNNAFAKATNKSSTTINHIVDGKNKPGFDLLESIFRAFPQVSRDWLLMGEGRMFREQIEKPEILNDSNNYLKEYLQRLEQNFAKISEQLSFTNQQLEVKDKQIEGLQRMLEKTLLGKSSGVHQSQTGSNVRKHPYAKDVRVSAVKENSEPQAA